MVYHGVQTLVVRPCYTGMQVVATGERERLAQRYSLKAACSYRLISVTELHAIRILLFVCDTTGSHKCKPVC